MCVEIKDWNMIAAFETEHIPQETFRSYAILIIDEVVYYKSTLKNKFIIDPKPEANILKPYILKLKRGI